MTPAAPLLLIRARGTELTLRAGHLTIGASLGIRRRGLYVSLVYTSAPIDETRLDCGSGTRPCVWIGHAAFDLPDAAAAARVQTFLAAARAARDATHDKESRHA